MRRTGCTLMTVQSLTRFMSRVLSTEFILSAKGRFVGGVLKQISKRKDIW